MSAVNVRFIVGELSDDDVQALSLNEAIISKMILSPDDFKLFQYKEGDRIEAESEHGHRQWCRIANLEVIQDPDSVIVIFTLVKDNES